MAGNHRHIVAAAVVLVTLAAIVQTSDAFKIGAFNIQILGQSKVSKPDVMTVLAQVSTIKVENGYYDYSFDQG